ALNQHFGYSHSNESRYRNGRCAWRNGLARLGLIASRTPPCDESTPIPLLHWSTKWHASGSANIFFRTLNCANQIRAPFAFRRTLLRRSRETISIAGLKSAPVMAK